MTDGLASFVVGSEGTPGWVGRRLIVHTLPTIPRTRLDKKMFISISVLVPIQYGAFIQLQTATTHPGVE